ncbi:hypothetical protein ABVT39_025275 [Epinephelus coioides]
MGSTPADESCFDGDWAVVISEPMAGPGNHPPARPVTTTLSPNRTDAAATPQPGEGPVNPTSSAAMSSAATSSTSVEV